MDACNPMVTPVSVGHLRLRVSMGDQPRHWDTVRANEPVSQCACDFEPHVASKRLSLLQWVITIIITISIITIISTIVTITMPAMPIIIPVAIITITMFLFNGR